MSIEARLQELGIVLPEPFQGPAGVKYPFSWVRVAGNRAYVSGHLPLNRDGSLTILGKVGDDLTLEQGAQAARLCGLAMLGSLERQLGTLDRITAWLRLLGMVNAAPGFDQSSGVVNGSSQLLVDVFGPEVGTDSRSAVGMAEL